MKLSIYLNRHVFVMLRFHYMSRNVRKRTLLHVHPAKTQIIYFIDLVEISPGSTRKLLFVTSYWLSCTAFWNGSTLQGKKGKHDRDASPESLPFSLLSDCLFSEKIPFKIFFKHFVVGFIFIQVTRNVLDAYWTRSMDARVFQLKDF